MSIRRRALSSSGTEIGGGSVVRSRPLSGFLGEEKRVTKFRRERKKRDAPGEEIEAGFTLKQICDLQWHGEREQTKYYLAWGLGTRKKGRG